MKTLGYYNGRYDEIEKMSVPMNDRVCWFGDGVYDATMARNYVIYALDEHLDRIYNSMAGMRIRPPMPKYKMGELLNGLVKKLDTGDQFVYWQVTRGTDDRNHVFGEGPSNLWVTLRPRRPKDTYKPVILITAVDERFYYCNIKTLNLLPSVLASQRAKEAGADECVFVRDGFVTECAHSNVHILKDGAFITHPADKLILPGIARAHLLRWCRQNGVKTELRPFTKEELFDADEVIVSSSGSFCLQAAKVDGRAVGGGAPELLKAMQDAMVRDFAEKTGGGTVEF
ncbi:MAG: aminotransferase class IV [Clostridia bacterium]|nr:aminotransferase class IV [Clostridia bacterium]